LSRRDDIESLAYTLIYLAGRDPPGSELLPLSRDELLRSSVPGWVANAKIEACPSSFCGNLPKPFAQLWKYSRTLAFDQQPECDSFRIAFKELAASEDSLRRVVNADEADI